MKYELVKRYIASVLPAWTDEQVSAAAIRYVYSKVIMVRFYIVCYWLLLYFVCVFCFSLSSVM